MGLCKTSHRRVSAQTVHGVLRKLTVGGTQVAVSIIVAEAHELNTRPLEPTIFDKFVSFGYVRTPHTRLIKVFTTPDDSKHSKKDGVIKQSQEEALEAARPGPAPAEPLAKEKQLSIASFFVANNTQHWTLLEPGQLAVISVQWCGVFVCTFVSTFCSDGPVNLGGFHYIGGGSGLSGGVPC